MTGGAGADRFRWETDLGDEGLSQGGTDRITDFTDGADRIVLELASIGVDRFGDVRVQDRGANVLIKVPYSISGEDMVQKIVLVGVDHALIGAADFDFL
jgi:Ca2+-binding RTX toxin-like protein